MKTQSDRAKALVDALVRDLDPLLRAWDFLHDECGMLDPADAAARFAWWCAVYGMYGAVS